MTAQDVIHKKTSSLEDVITSYKLELLKNHSKITAKNYISDINHFTGWFARKQGVEFSPESLSKTVLIDYRYSLGLPQEGQSAALSYKSLRRHMSSLRSFTQYLTLAGLLATNPFHEDIKVPISDFWKLNLFKSTLQEQKSSNLTIKYYINDVKSFIKWVGEVEKTNGEPTYKTITADLFFEYVSRLKTQSGLSPRSINRKLSSIRKYLNFLNSQDFSQTYSSVKNVKTKEDRPVDLESLVISQTEQSFSNVSLVRLFQRFIGLYANLEEKTANLISSKLISSRFRDVISSSGTHKMDQVFSKLNGYGVKKEFYAPYSISTESFPTHKRFLYHAKHTRPEWYKRYHSYPIVHYLHLGILVVFAVGISIFLYNNTLGTAGAETRSQIQSKTFVFKGKLLDKSGNPVTNSTDVRLALYSSPIGNEYSPLWKEVQTGISPDSEGNVILTVGSRNQIPASLLDQNEALYLGVGIGDGKELTPRQQIGVSFSTSSQNVQGLTPITSSDRQTNVLLALDASGDLTIGGSASPVFQATGGEFTLSGQTMILTTNASTDGNIVLNPDGNGTIDILKPLTSSSGALTVRGIFSIEATESTQSAISISQTNTGPIITASTVGKKKFEIDNQGVITKGEWAGSPIGTEFGGFGASITATGPGELLYSTSNTTYGHLAPGAAGDCLISNGRTAPLWSPCGFLTQLNGNLTLTNNTLDFVLGGVSTSSAKFAFRNMSSGTPTFSVGSSLNISSDNLIEAINSDLKLGGSSTKNVLLASAGGNVGIGNSLPTRTLDVNGSFGGNVDYYTDGSGNNEIIRNTKALVYDLEKNAGSSEISTKTTYDITGLPDIDGTIAYVYTKVSKKETLSSLKQSLDLKINGYLLSSISTNETTNEDETIKHYTAVRSNSKWHLLGSYGDSDKADLAEWTEAQGKIPEPGSILSIAENGKVEKSKSDHDPKLAGIVSTNPNIVIGPQTQTSVKLALSGRVPTIVTSLSGNISEGDSITSSSLPGIGMKPEVNSSTVGKALEEFSPNDTKCIEIDSFEDVPWPEDNGTNKLKPCFKIKVQNLSNNVSYNIMQDYGITNVDYIYIGKIMVLSNLSWSNTDELMASIGSATAYSDEIPSLDSLDTDFSNTIEEINKVNTVVKTGGKTIKKISSFGAVVAGKVKAGSITATNIAGRNLVAAKGIIEDLSSNNITARNSITSPLARINELKTDIISPNKSGQVVINIPGASGSALIVRNSGTEKEVAKIDSEGNASFSGTLSSNSISSTDASISGTLRASNLVADNISGLDEKVSTLATQIVSNIKQVENIPASQLSEYFSENSVVAKFGTFHEGLLSLGASTFGSLSVMDQLSVGTSFVFTNNSINTLGTDLSIQPLKQGAVSFLSGALRIEIDGRLIVAEDALFKKNLAVEGKIYTNGLEASGSARFAEDLEARQGTFSKINFNLVEQAYAIDLNTATATTSAGTALLKENSNELTIYNPLVGKSSLVYITPANNTNNNVMFLMRQNPEDIDIEGTEGSFTVGVSQSLPQDTLFNWLIVN